MARNLVVCSDGTGNTFDSRVTNVTHLVRCLDVDSPERQLVIYDQGVGTTARRGSEVGDLAGGGMQVLPAPVGTSWLTRVRGLLFGHGLRQNVRQMYTELARHHTDGDAVFLFGFSRGAFTVRALAGLLHRCHLPPPDADLDAAFELAWQLFQPMVADPDAVGALRAAHRPCPVHLLGLWDTVKSYGGLDPVILPHLRHNPDVAHVRHALALDERRAWFKPTTWGQLDSDRGAAMSRLDHDDAAAYDRQDISEVWFTGCHSDVGGGVRQEVTARIALRWMLGEAAAVEPGLVLAEAGTALLAEQDPSGPPQVHQSWTWPWRLVEQIRRREIDNSGVYPEQVWHRGSDGVREVDLSRRHGRIAVHATVQDPQFRRDDVDVVATRGLPPGPGDHRRP